MRNLKYDLAILLVGVLVGATLCFVGVKLSELWGMREKAHAAVDRSRQTVPFEQWHNIKDRKPVKA